MEDSQKSKDYIAERDDSCRRLLGKATQSEVDSHMSKV
jgi:hypothetical protein